jgi:hypothetical protein
MLMTASIAPKTNISKAYYHHLIDNIEHDPLVKHSTLSIACLLAAICVLLGSLIWFAKVNPGNLIKTDAVVTNISSGRTDSVGTITSFVSFDFKTRDNIAVSARQPAPKGIFYEKDQEIVVGYNPINPNFARLNDDRVPIISYFLWFIPFYLMIWFIIVALFRHHSRQLLIWKAAEAADAND